jgi:hypothetical protein
MARAPIISTLPISLALALSAAFAAFAALTA